MKALRVAREHCYTMATARESACECRAGSRADTRNNAHGI
jgi:hypothetical protein